MNNQVGDGRVRVPKKTTGKGAISGSGKNLVQGNVPEIYKGNLSSDS